VKQAKEKPKPIKRVVLVYQAGIANVFAVESFNLSDYGRDARRLIQADFYGCEQFARGLGAAGVKVRTAACNQEGDVIGATWSEDLDEQPFSHKFAPVTLNCSESMADAFDMEDGQ